MAKPLIEAVADFLGPIMAEYAQLVEFSPPDTPLLMSLGGYRYETTMRALQELDAAYAEAFDRNSRAACARRARKAAGSLL